MRPAPLSSLSLFLGLSATAQAGVKYMGIAISGIDFNCDITGICPYDNVQVPLASLGGADGAAQMKHFVDDDGINMFRLPFSWQFLLAGTTIGELNSDRLQNYDELVNACLDTGAYCMIDMHNFARFEDKIIGQGGPSNDDFASLWSTLATRYGTSDRIVFQLMNEPHDLDIGEWAATCQAAVTAIRNAGASSQMILLPGTFFSSAATITSDGSADALFEITNPDGSTDGLILDVHKYLDTPNSGILVECTTNNVGNFTKVATYLREKKRLALISETGASNDATCMTLFPEQNTYINENSDVFIGIVGWAAGNFATTYLLSLTPSLEDGKYVDNEVMKQAILAPWKSGSAAATSSSASSSSSTRASSSASSSASSKSSSSASSTTSSAKTTSTKSTASSTLASVTTTTPTVTGVADNAGSSLAATASSASGAMPVSAPGGALAKVASLVAAVAALLI